MLRFLVLRFAGLKGAGLMWISIIWQNVGECKEVVVTVLTLREERSESRLVMWLSRILFPSLSPCLCFYGRPSWNICQASWSLPLSLPVPSASACFSTLHQPFYRFDIFSSRMYGFLHHFAISNTTCFCINFAGTSDLSVFFKAGSMARVLRGSSWSAVACIVKEVLSKLCKAFVEGRWACGVCHDTLLARTDFYTKQIWWQWYYHSFGCEEANFVGCFNRHSRSGRTWLSNCWQKKS